MRQPVLPGLAPGCIVVVATLRQIRVMSMETHWADGYGRILREGKPARIVRDRTFDPACPGLAARVLPAKCREVLTPLVIQAIGNPGDEHSMFIDKVNYMIVLPAAVARSARPAAIRAACGGGSAIMHAQRTAKRRRGELSGGRSRP